MNDLIRKQKVTISSIYGRTCVDSMWKVTEEHIQVTNEIFYRVYRVRNITLSDSDTNRKYIECLFKNYEEALRWVRILENSGVL